VSEILPSLIFTPQFLQFRLGRNLTRLAGLRLPLSSNYKVVLKILGQPEPFAAQCRPGSEQVQWLRFFWALSADCGPP
jgi:hypothetical protein